MRRIVNICWNSHGNLWGRTRKWIVRLAAEIAAQHEAMHNKCMEVETWLIEYGIHASYVEVMMNEIDHTYLRPCANMHLIERTNFTEMYRRFRGTGSQFFNIPTILTLYIMGNNKDVGEVLVKAAIREGVESCKKKKQLLDRVVETLKVFEMEINTRSQTCLLRSSLNLVPMSYCIYNESVLVETNHDTKKHCDSWIAVRTFVSSLLFSASLVHRQHVDAFVIRSVLEDVHLWSGVEAHGNSMSIMAPWITWTKENHKWIASPMSRMLVREGMLMLYRNGVRGDLAAHVAGFLFL
jgi:hypothetical protein